MAILVFSPNGTYITKPTLEAARTSADCAGKNVVVTSALTAAQSDITAAWPTDRALEVKKGGSIGNTLAFTINGSFSAGLYQVFAGTGAVGFATAHDSYNYYNTGGVLMISPAWWGAIANDTTKATINTAAFNAAFNAAANVGGTVQVPLGLYFLSSAIIMQPETSLAGVSKLGSILRRTGLGGSVITVDGGIGAGPVRYKSCISNLSIQGGTPAGGTYADYGIYYRNASGINMSTNAISATNVSGIELVGVALGAAIGVIIDKNDIYSNLGDGIRSSGAVAVNNISITNNVITENAGIGINATVGYFGWSITGNDVEANRGGYQIYASALFGANISGNYSEEVSPFVGPAWKFSNCNGISITGNRISSAAGYANIEIGGGTASNNSGMVVMGNFLSATAPDSAINLISPIGSYSIGPNYISGGGFHVQTAGGLKTTEQIVTASRAVVVNGIGPGIFNKLSGVIYSSAIAIGTPSATGIVALMQAAIPPYTLGGGFIRVTASGTTGADANNKTITLRFGSTDIATTGISAANGKSWIITATIGYISDTSQTVSSRTQIDTDLPGVTKDTAMAENLLATNTLYIAANNGSAVANDIVQTSMIVELLN